LVSGQWVLLSVILLCVAAETYELAPLLAQSRWIRRTSFGYSADWGEHRLVAAFGTGPESALEAMKLAMKTTKPDAVISAGVCGALKPFLRVGDIFVADEIVFRSRHYSCTRPRTLKPYSSGVLTSQDRVAVTAAEKATLAANGCSAVDMESGAVAAGLVNLGVPLYCIRAVSDLADEGFAIDFNEMRDSRGHFSRAKILRAALGSPIRLVPELRRIRRNTRLAARALGDFLADCRF
jgi:adenosylhomocysteine nucleosidase